MTAPDQGPGSGSPVDYRGNPSAGSVDLSSSHLDGYDNPIETVAQVTPPMPDQTWKAYDDVEDATAFQSLHSPAELAAYHEDPPGTTQGFSPSAEEMHAWQRAGGDGGRAQGQSIPFGDPA